jgi:hypothetical protein
MALGIPNLRYVADADGLEIEQKLMFFWQRPRDSRSQSASADRREE